MSCNWLRKIPVIGTKLNDMIEAAPVVAVIRLDGVIGKTGGIRPSGLALSDLGEVIERAFETPKVKAVALAVNSPGGSPVQSALIAEHIRQWADEKKIPVLAFCEDAAASGGYWLACSADEIFAMDASIVGSIGVISGGFGYTGLIEKIGVERRIYTAGTSKSRLDPFMPEKKEDVKFLRNLQDDIHEVFKAYIKTRRGDRLKGEDKDIFSGSFWTGGQALEKGLIDGLGDMRSICRDRFGEKVKFENVGEKKGWLQKKLGMSAPIPNSTSIGEAIGKTITTQTAQEFESRIWWSRLGL